MRKTGKKLAVLASLVMLGSSIAVSGFTAKGETSSIVQSELQDENTLKLKVHSDNWGYPFIYVSIETYNGKAPYTYSYELVDDETGKVLDKKENVVYESEKITITANTDAYSQTQGAYPTQGFVGYGYKHLNFVLTDSEGKTYKCSDGGYIEPFSVYDISNDKGGKSKVGETICLNAYSKNRFNGYSSRAPLNYSWKVENTSRGTVEKVYGISASNTCYWTPTEPGRYIITATTNDGLVESSKSVKYEVCSEKETMIYYSNSNWENAYIHYKTENGKWTDVPGVKMASSDNVNYTWMYDIDLSADDSDNVLVCFNNGNGSWDSRNASNYQLSNGVYAIENNNIEKLNFMVTSFTIDKPSPSYYTDFNNIKFAASADYGSGDYSFKFGTYYGGRKIYASTSETSDNKIEQKFSMYNFTPYAGQQTLDGVGTHAFFVEVTDNVTGEVVSKTINNYEIMPMKITSFTSDSYSNVIKVGTKVNLFATVEGELGYRYATHQFSVIKDGNESILNYRIVNTSYTNYWIPNEAGEYTLKYYVCDGYSQRATAYLHFRVVENNKTTVYYSNSNWENAYIHYKVNGGEWTAVTGVKMDAVSDVDGYQWKFDIDLGEADGATICFNNGNGSWDSRNSENYYVGKGIVGVKNGNINNLK